jgi:hypothetical protein
VFGFLLFHSTTKIISRVRHVLFLFIFCFAFCFWFFFHVPFFLSHISACMRVSNWQLFDRKLA